LIFSVHQPNILPYLGFWKKVIDSDVFDIAIYYDYSNTAYTNFVPLGKYGETGKKIKLSLKSSRQKIFMLELLEGTQDRFLYEIKEAYSHLPYYNVYMPAIEDIFSTKYKYMWELNFRLLVEIRDILGIPTQFVISERPEKRLPPTDELIRVCKIHNATTYISGMKGEEYLEKEKFAENGIELRFQNGWDGDKNSILASLFSFGSKETFDIIQRG